MCNRSTRNLATVLTFHSSKEIVCILFAVRCTLRKLNIVKNGAPPLDASATGHMSIEYGIKSYVGTNGVTVVVAAISKLTVIGWFLRWPVRANSKHVGIPLHALVHANMARQACRQTVL